MKKYEKPELIEETVEIEDIIASSSTLGGLPGDVEQGWTWGN